MAVLTNGSAREKWLNTIATFSTWPHVSTLGKRLPQGVRIPPRERVAWWEGVATGWGHKSSAVAARPSGRLHAMLQQEEGKGEKFCF
jgi:hypothetical protein